MATISSLNLGIIQLRVRMAAGQPASNKPVYITLTSGGPARLYRENGTLLSAQGYTSTDATGLVRAYVADQHKYRVSVRAAFAPAVGFGNEVFFSDNLEPTPVGLHYEEASGSITSATLAQMNAGSVGHVVVNVAGELISPSGLVIEAGGGSSSPPVLSYNATTSSLELTVEATVASTVPFTEFTNVSGTRKLYALI